MDSKAESNRRNARRSTGPRTPAGKLNSSRNALKHGLASAVPASDTRIKAIGDTLGGAGAVNIDDIAEATAQLDEIRRVQTQLIEMAIDDAQVDADDLDKPLVVALALASVADRLDRLDRYERRAISRRKSAIRRLDRATERAEETKP